MAPYDEQLTEPTGIGAAKGLSDGTLVVLRGVGTASFSDSEGVYGYIEQGNRVSAIRVNSSSPSVGNSLAVLRVVGRLGTNISTGERQIADEFGAEPVSSGSVSFVAMNNRTVAAGDFAGGWGVPGNVGANTVGLLIRTWGRVVQIEPDRKSFVIDDGSGMPLHVTDFWYDAPPWLQVGSFVKLQGSASIFNDRGARVRCIRVPWWYHDTWVPWRVN